MITGAFPIWPSTLQKDGLIFGIIFGLCFLILMKTKTMLLAYQFVPLKSLRAIFLTTSHLLILMIPVLLDEVI
ncbi:hypothetical protein TSH64_16110 [Azospirillum sp. TSH64]|nr:hypothetical protein TSH64_16110 [Azospirillum sp. TSH64]